MLVGGHKGGGTKFVITDYTLQVNLPTSWGVRILDIESLMLPKIRQVT